MADILRRLDTGFLPFKYMLLGFSLYYNANAKARLSTRVCISGSNVITKAPCIEENSSLNTLLIHVANLTNYGTQQNPVQQAPLWEDILEAYTKGRGANLAT